MAISLGFTTTSNLNPNGNSQTLSVACSNGSDKGLLVCITMPSTVNFSSAKYDGTSMTLVSNTLYSGLSQRQAFYWLANPTSGSAKNLVINFTGGQFGNTSIMAQSFTGVDVNIGNSVSTGGQSSPNSKTLNVSAGSIIYATGISNTAQNFNYTINGSGRNPVFQGHNTYKIVEGAFSALNLPAGSISVITRADSGSVTNNRVEVKEAGSVDLLSCTAPSVLGLGYAIGGESIVGANTINGSGITGTTEFSCSSIAELSFTGVTWSDTLTSSSVNFSAPIYVRLKSGLSVGTYNGYVRVENTTLGEQHDFTISGEVTPGRNRIRVV